MNGDKLQKIEGFLSYFGSRLAFSILLAIPVMGSLVISALIKDSECLSNYDKYPNVKNVITFILFVIIVTVNMALFVASFKVHPAMYLVWAIPSTYSAFKYGP